MSKYPHTIQNGEGEALTFPGIAIFPVMIGIGRLLGKYEKFRDAPEPTGRILTHEASA